MPLDGPTDPFGLEVCRHVLGRLAVTGESRAIDRIAPHLVCEWLAADARAAYDRMGFVELPGFAASQRALPVPEAIRLLARTQAYTRPTE